MSTYFEDKVRKVLTNELRTENQVFEYYLMKEQSSLRDEDKRHYLDKTQSSGIRLTMLSRLYTSIFDEKSPVKLPDISLYMRRTYLER